MKYLLITLLAFTNFIAYAQIKTPVTTTKKIVQVDKKAKRPLTLSEKLKLKKTNKEDVLTLDFPIFRLIVSFTLLFGVLGGVFYGLKKWGKRFTGLENSATIKVISRAHLDGKNYLAVVRVYEEEMLLGVGGNGINLISRFSPIGEGEIEANNPDNNNSIFDTELKSLITPGVVSEEIKGN